MKTCAVIFIAWIALLGACRTTEPTPNRAINAAIAAFEKKRAAILRLSDVDAFPEDYRPAVRAAVGALSADGRTASEYFAVVGSTKDGHVEVDLIHESCPTDSNLRGDPCGHCRIAFFDPMTMKLSRLSVVQ